MLDEMGSVAVACRAVGSGWTCRVEVVEGDSTSTHSVTVGPADLARLDPLAEDPTELVRRSFEFLLAREPKESILASFDLPMIGRYFPEYEPTIRVP
jgi:hypothetical protein